jgi:kynurenine formamidase
LSAPDPETVLAALRLVRSGTVVDLSTPIDERAPRMEGMAPYAIDWWQHPVASADAFAAAGARNGAAFADEHVAMDLHTGTHVDALGHAFADGAGFGGVAVEDAVGECALTELGAERIPPLIARGVLLDVARHGGRELRGGDAIAVAELEAAATAAEVELRAGDVVLIRTGWGPFYRSDPQRYASAWPGIGLAAARWLTDRGALAVGADNMALEPYPEADPAEVSPVHLHMLVETGTYIVEQVDLERLAELAPREFLCLGLAPRFVGASAAPLRLTAVL